MKFEVVDRNNRTVMNTSDLSCIPNKEQINSMSKAGYKFKIDGKAINKNKIQSIYNKEGFSE